MPGGDKLASNKNRGGRFAMAGESSQRPVYASAGWEIDLARRELRSMGVHVPLGSRAFEIIAELVQAAGELISKEEGSQKRAPIRPPRRLGPCSRSGR